MSDQGASGDASANAMADALAKRARARQMRDKALVEGARSGDATAFGKLYDAWVDSVYDRAISAGASAAEAREITEHTFLAVHRDLPKLKQPAAFGAKVLQVARRETQAKVGGDRPGHAPTGAVGTAEDRLTRATDAGATAADHDVAIVLREAAHALDEKTREILDLHFRQGLTRNETAAVLAEQPDKVAETITKLPRALAALTRARVLWRGGQPEDAALRDELQSEGITTFGAGAVRVINKFAAKNDRARARSLIGIPPIELFSAVPLADAPAGLKTAVATVLVTESVPMEGSAFVRRDDKGDIIDAPKAKAAPGSPSSSVRPGLDEKARPALDTKKAAQVAAAALAAERASDTAAAAAGAADAAAVEEKAGEKLSRKDKRAADKEAAAKESAAKEAAAKDAAAKDAAAKDAAAAKAAAEKEAAGKAAAEKMAAVKEAAAKDAAEKAAATKAAAAAGAAGLAGAAARKDEPEVKPALPADDKELVEKAGAEKAKAASLEADVDAGKSSKDKDEKDDKSVAGAGVAAAVGAAAGVAAAEALNDDDEAAASTTADDAKGAAGTAGDKAGAKDAKKGKGAKGAAAGAAGAAALGGAAGAAAASADAPTTEIGAVDGDADAGEGKGKGKGAGAGKAAAAGAAAGAVTAGATGKALADEAPRKTTGLEYVGKDEDSGAGMGKWIAGGVAAVLLIGLLVFLATRGGGDDTGNLAASQGTTTSAQPTTTTKKASTTTSAKATTTTAAPEETTTTVDPAATSTTIATPVTTAAGGGGGGGGGGGPVVPPPTAAPTTAAPTTTRVFTQVTIDFQLPETTVSNDYLMGSAGAPKLTWNVSANGPVQIQIVGWGNASSTGFQDTRMSSGGPVPLCPGVIQSSVNGPKCHMSVAGPFNYTITVTPLDNPAGKQVQQRSITLL